MPTLNHWNPVLLSRQLRRKPTFVRLDGRPIAVFRDEAGKPAAVSDVCPHRRMSLSKGHVVRGRLVCPYHGWSYTPRGAGESPGTPKLRCEIEAYDVREEHGAIWLKRAGVPAPFPTFPTEGFLPISQHHHIVAAPMGVTLDNFCEMEHTGATHTVFGYDLDRLSEVAMSVESDETEIRVQSSGPPKPSSWLMRQLMGIRKDVVFHDNWVTRFSPVHNIHEHDWIDPRTNKPALFRMKIVNLFAPADANSTILVLLVYGWSAWPGPAGGLRLARPFLGRVIEKEVLRDVWMLNNLRDKVDELPGMKLSRFDKALGPTRERLRRVYYGEANSVRTELPVTDPV
jgi:nitrite reductase/ring-hydroxylating ferredoxin subunit